MLLKIKLIIGLLKVIIPLAIRLFSFLYYKLRPFTLDSK